MCACICTQNNFLANNIQKLAEDTKIREQQVSERKVPYEAVMEMRRNFHLPTTAEGFDQVCMSRIESCETYCTCVTMCVCVFVCMFACVCAREYVCVCVYVCKGEILWLAL
jgi:hypothetical protein